MANGRLGHVSIKQTILIFYAKDRPMYLKGSETQIFYSKQKSISIDGWRSVSMYKYVEQRERGIEDSANADEFTNRIGTSTSAPSAPHPTQKPEFQCFTFHVSFSFVSYSFAFCVFVCACDSVSDFGMTFRTFCAQFIICTQNLCTSIVVVVVWRWWVVMLNVAHQAFSFHEHVLVDRLWVRATNGCRMTPKIIINFHFHIFFGCRMERFALRISNLSQSTIELIWFFGAKLKRKKIQDNHRQNLQSED